MDGREARFAIGFTLLGVAPLLVGAAGATVGAVVFAVGLVIATTTAFG